MSPSELEEELFKEPFRPFRITVASGDQVVIDNPRRALISGLSMYYGMAEDPAARVGNRTKIISIPNIVLIEPLDPRRGTNGRRRR